MNELGSFALIVRVGRARELRRVLLAYAGFSISEYATWLAVLFYALERGGPQEVGLVAFLQLIPAVLVTPFASYAGDRFRPQRALAAGYAAQSAAMVVVAVAMLSGNWLLVYTASAVAAAAISFTRPVMGCLLPTLTHTPTDLIGANVVAGMIQQTGVFLGPLLAGAVMVVGSPTGVFATCAVITGLGCLAVLATPVLDEEPSEVPDLGDLTERLFAGFATLRRESRVRILVGVIVVAGLVNGVADVLFVTFTDERLDGGGGQAGLLAAAYGVGGLVGAIAVARIVRNRTCHSRIPDERRAGRWRARRDGGNRRTGYGPGALRSARRRRDVPEARRLGDDPTTVPDGGARPSVRHRRGRPDGGHRMSVRSWSRSW